MGSDRAVTVGPGTRRPRVSSRRGPKDMEAGMVGDLRIG